MLGPVYVINSDRSSLLAHLSQIVVFHHMRAYGLPMEAVPVSSVEDKPVSCSTVADAWGVLACLVSPNTTSQRLLLKHEFMHVSCDPRSDPENYFAHFDSLNNKTPALPISKNSEQLLAGMIPNLRDKYSLQRAFFQLKLSVIRKDVKTAIRDAYAGRRMKQILQPFYTNTLSASS